MPRDRDRARRSSRAEGGAYRPITVARYIQESTAFLLAEDAVNLPGVQLVLEPIRDYPSGALTSHIIGYMGHIPEEQLAGIRGRRGTSRTNKWAWQGWRSAFEDELRGKPGRQTIEVDVHGRRVRTVGEAEPAQPGHNLVLSLDLELQRVATEALQEALDASDRLHQGHPGRGDCD